MAAKVGTNHMSLLAKAETMESNMFWSKVLTIIAILSGEKEARPSEKRKESAFEELVN